MKVTTKRAMLRAAIAASNGRAFTVTFIKKDGSERVMNCRTGVKKHLAGGKSTINHKENLVSVFDMQVQEYRCVNLDTVTDLTIDGQSVNIAA